MYANKSCRAVSRVSFVHELGFDPAQAAFHRGIIPTISFAAHRLNHPGFIEDLAVVGSSILAAAIGVMDKARRGLLALNCHGQSRDGQFRPHVVTHGPAHNLPREKIKHDGKIEPAFGGCDISYVGEPHLIGAFGSKVLIEPVGGNRKIVMAVGGAYPEAPRHPCPYAVMPHETFNAATACLLPQVAQGHVDPWRTIAAAMGHMEAPDLGEQGAIGQLAQAFRPAAPGIIARRRNAHHIAHDTDRKRLTLIFDEAESHFGGSEKMRSVFFKISRSMRRRSFSRRRRVFSAARSTPAGGIAACVLGRRGDPAWPPPLLLRQARSRAAGIPSSSAIWLSGQSLFASSPTASCLNSSVY